jgi:hypothetical protein
MLKVNVGLIRKISRDYNSTGFSLNLEGEIAAPLDDPEQVIERIREYYDVAEAALQDQIDRHQSESALAGRDADESGQGGAANGPTIAKPARPQRPRDGQPSDRQPAEPASDKQRQYLLAIAKRQGLATEALDARIAAVLGHSVGLSELSKREAGQVIDNLTQGGAGEARPARRS